MWTTFRYSLRRFRGRILAWGLSLGAMGMLLIPFYDTFQDNQAEMALLLESYPQEMLAFFGDFANFTTPHGYLDVYLLSYIPIILGIFTIGAGSGMLASDEESGRLDLLMSYPVSRSRLFFGRLAAFWVALAGILVLTWLGFASVLGSSTIDITYGQLVLPFLVLLVHSLAYGNLGLVLSMLMPSHRMASMVAGLVMVGSWVLTSIAGLNPDLERMANLTPYAHAQGGDAIYGLDWPPFLGLLGVSVVCALIAWWRFTRRDIRVGGEGGWSMPRWARRRA